jgi:hypothetical protein
MQTSSNPTTSAFKGFTFFTLCQTHPGVCQKTPSCCITDGV